MLTGLVVAGSILVVGIALIAFQLSLGLDRRYIGVIPGTWPRKGEDPEVRFRRLGQHHAVAVRFTAPDASPALCGVILTEHAGITEVTATITDLALRGHLRIDELVDGDFLLTRIESAEELAAYEAILLDGIFDGREERLLSDLRGGFADAVRKARIAMLEEATALGWFRGNPRHVESFPRQLLGGVLVGGLVVLVLAKDWNLLWGLGPLVLLSLMYVAVADRLPARTAEGTVILQQVLGFRRYLGVAEAGQLAAEEERNVLGRHLPYAQVFGFASDWAGRFANAAAALPDTWAESWWDRPWRRWRLRTGRNTQLDRPS